MNNPGIISARRGQEKLDLAPIVVDDIDASVDITSGTVNDDPTDINVSSQASVTPSDYLWLNCYALAEATWTSGDGVTSTASSAAYGAIAMR